MMKEQKKLATIDDYIATYPAEIQALLQKMRSTIQKAAPAAAEAISYGLPTYKQEGNLVHFGGFKSHIGFYPGPDAIEAFKKELAAYPSSKGAIQFPLDKALPLALVKSITQYRVAKNKEAAEAKKKKKG